MSERFGVDVAWGLVRALSPGTATAGAPARVEHDGVAIEVDESGRWSGEASPDDGLGPGNSCPHD